MSSHSLESLARGSVLCFNFGGQGRRTGQGRFGRPSSREYREREASCGSRVVTGWGRRCVGATGCWLLGAHWSSSSLSEYIFSDIFFAVFNSSRPHLPPAAMLFSAPRVQHTHTKAARLGTTHLFWDCLRLLPVLVKSSV